MAARNALVNASMLPSSCLWRAVQISTGAARTTARGVPLSCCPAVLRCSDPRILAAKGRGA